MGLAVCDHGNISLNTLDIRNWHIFDRIKYWLVTITSCSVQYCSTYQKRFKEISCITSLATVMIAFCTKIHYQAVQYYVNRQRSCHTISLYNAWQTNCRENSDARYVCFLFYQIPWVRAQGMRSRWLFANWRQNKLPTGNAHGANNGFNHEVVGKLSI